MPSQWNDLYAMWLERAGRLGMDDHRLFSAVRIQALAPETRAPQFDWTPREALGRFAIRHQTWFVENPAGDGPLASRLNAVRRYTLQTLWDLRDDAEKTAAFIILAQLENYARLAPGLVEKAVAADVEAAAVQGLGFRPKWHHMSDGVIPCGFGEGAYETFTRFPTLRQVEALMDFLAVEHTLRLRAQTIGVLSFGHRMDRKVKAHFDAKRAEAEEAYADELARMEERRRAEAERLARRAARELEQRARRATSPVARPVGPSATTLRKIPKDELARLVWSMPVTDLALDFGVTDVAVGKRCQELGIEKPPRGFWAKVRAGLLEHPEGVPGRVVPAYTMEGPAEGPAPGM